MEMGLVQILLQQPPKWLRLWTQVIGSRSQQRSHAVYRQSDHDSGADGWPGSHHSNERRGVGRDQRNDHHCIRRDYILRLDSRPHRPSRNGG